MSGSLSLDKIKELSDIFTDYKNDKNLSTQQIAIKLGINRTTVNKYFRRFFGEEYTKISKVNKNIINKL